MANRPISKENIAPLTIIAAHRRARETRPAARRIPPELPTRPRSRAARRPPPLAAVRAGLYSLAAVWWIVADRLGRAGGCFFLTEGAGGGVAISWGRVGFERARDSAQRASGRLFFLYAKGRPAS